MWDEITYSSQNFNDGSVEVWELVSDFHTFHGMWLLIHAGIKAKPC